MSTEFYPGSSRKRKSYDPITEPRQEPELEDLTLGKSKTYLVQGQPVEFYHIGDLARALNRSTVTIRKLEANGFLPLSPYFSPGIDDRGKRRLYTKQQIEALRRVAQEEGVLHPSDRGKWKAIEKTQFTRKATEAFRNLPA